MIRKAGLICIVIATLVWTGSAYALSFTVSNFGSDNVTSMTASVTDIVGGVKLTVDVSGGPIVADITGVFFDLEQPFVDTTPITVSSFNFILNEGNVSKAPNNSNIGGNVPNFDVGVAIGALGLTDDYQMVMFDVLGTGLDESDFTRLGVRLQSVGMVGGSRSGSAKYAGEPGPPQPAPVPEPATMLLLGVGVAGLAGFRKKIRK